MPHLPWKCVACCTAGAVEYDPAGKVGDSLRKIRAEHVAVSPACAYDPENIRVKFLPGAPWLTVRVIEEEE